MADDQDALKWAVAAFKSSALDTGYDLYRRYYRGSQDLNFLSPKWLQTFGFTFQRLAYNRCKGVVDAMADRLKLERFNVEKGESGGDSAEETAGDLWRRNRMDKIAGEIHRGALRDGDAYVLVWPESGNKFGTDGAFPQFWPQHASQVRVRYDDEQPGLITLAARSWRLRDKRRRLNLYFPNRTEKYVTRGQASTTQAAALDHFMVPGEPWPVPNPWNTVPMFHFANDADTGEYGYSELHDVMPLQDSINATIGNLLLTVEHAGFPLKVIRGLDAGDPAVIEGLRRIEAGLNKIITIPVEPGGVMPAIDEFSAADLGQLIKTADMFDADVSRVSRVPVHYLQMTGDFPSGRAMRTAEAPFVTKMEDRQTAFGNVWEDAMHLALRQAGVADPGMLTTVWKPAAPLSKEDQWDVALQQSAVGVPLEQILREVGYDEEEITTIVAERDAATERMEASLTGIGGGNEDDQGAIG